MQYTFRKSTFDKEHTYSLAPNGLLISSAQQPDVLIAFKVIQSIRLSYMPDRMRTNNFCCYITTAGSKFTLMSWSYVSLANFKEDAQGYKQFVLALIEKVHAANPSVLLLTGRPRGAYYGSILFMGISGIVLAVLFYAVGNAASGISLIKLALLLLLIPLAIRYIKKNKPGNFSAGLIPAHLLPA